MKIKVSQAIAVINSMESSAEDEIKRQSLHMAGIALKNKNPIDIGSHELRCPACGYDCIIPAYTGRIDSYCQSCGQRILWFDENGEVIE